MRKDIDNLVNTLNEVWLKLFATKLEKQMKAYYKLKDISKSDNEYWNTPAPEIDEKAKNQFLKEGFERAE